MSSTYRWKTDQNIKTKVIGKLIDKAGDGSTTWDLEGHFSDPSNPDTWVHMSTIRRTHSDSPVPQQFGTFIEDFGIFIPL